SVSVLTGRTTGGIANGLFNGHVDYSSAVSAMAVAVGDFTQDGRPDVALAMNSPLNRVAIYPGLGDGTLDGPFLLDVGAAPRTLLPGDFDGDGALDLIVASNLSNKLIVVRSSCPQEIASDLIVLAPNGGETWTAPSEQVIRWLRDPGCTGVNIDVTRNDGATWERIATNVVGTSYAWSVTRPWTTTARVRVSDAWRPAQADQSDADFNVFPPGGLDVAAEARAAFAIRDVTPNPLRDRVRIALALPVA